MKFNSAPHSQMDKFIDPANAKELRAKIDAAGKIVLTAHVRPDGDAIGSTLGLWHLFRTLGKDSVVIIPDKAPANLSFLPGFKEMAVYTCHSEYCEKTIADCDLILCCDFNTPSRQDSLAPVVQASKAEKILIDHHQEPDSFANMMFSFPDMSSTCEVCVRLTASMGLFGDVGIESATCFLTGIITDTRNFSVNCKHPDLYEILIKLVEKGVDKEFIVREAMNTKTLSALRLEAFALSQRLSIYPAHRAAIITLSKEDLDKFDYERGDSEGLVNRPLEVKGIVYSVFMREDPDCIKVSARSIDNFPVSEICKQLYGGGGHIMAAGGEFHGSLSDCKAMLHKAMPMFDKFIPRKKYPSLSHAVK